MMRIFERGEPARALLATAGEQRGRTGAREDARLAEQHPCRVGA